MVYKKMTDQEIKKLAEDIFRGLIFTDRQIQDKNEVSRVFMPLIFLNKKQMEELNNDNPGMIYEYMEKACNVSINGMPIFLSFCMISQIDAKKVFEKYNAILDSVKKI